MRYVIGIPFRHVYPAEPRFAGFVGMVDWICCQIDPVVLAVSSYPFLLATCPGGTEYLRRRGFSFDGTPAPVIVRDFGTYWSYLDRSTGQRIRSLEHLYSAIESWLETRPGKDVFLLTSGDPELGNALVDRWKERHGAMLRICSAQSPVNAAGDYVQAELHLADQQVPRCYLSGPETLSATDARLRSVTGLLLLLSTDDHYRKTDRGLPLAPRVFQKISDCFGPATEIFGFHAGVDHDFVFRSTAAKISGDLEQKEVERNGPYTFVIYREANQPAGATH